MDWLHRAANAHNEISLHDCRATHLTVCGDRIEFDFDSGFTLVSGTALNPSGRNADTGRSALVFPKAEAEFHLHTEHSLFRRNIFTIRRQIPLSLLAEKLKSGSWELEFIHEYYGYHSALFLCCIWQKHKPYHIDCQLELCCKEIEYYWNETV